VAQRIGRSANAVAIRRQKLGIPKFDHRSRPYTAEENRLMGTMPDKELARRLAGAVGRVF
jgi:hypothetical protein